MSVINPIDRALLKDPEKHKELAACVAAIVRAMPPADAEHLLVETFGLVLQQGRILAAKQIASGLRPLS